MISEDFSLPELQILHGLLHHQNAAFHANISRTVADLKDKLDAKIRQASAREERTQAASKLKAVQVNKAADDPA